MTPVFDEVRGDGWLRLACALPPPCEVWIDDRPLARLNAALVGSARVVRCGLRGPARLVADVRLDDRGDGRGAAVARADLADAWNLLAIHPEPEHDTAAVDVAVERDRAQPHEETEFIEAAREAGWRVAHASAGVSVELPTRGGRFVGLLEGTMADRRRVSVQVADIAGHPPIGERAVSSLLLRVGGALRLASGSVRRSNGARRAVVSAPVDRMSIEGIDLALSAVAAGCQVVGREIAALADEGLAREYLDMCGIWRENPNERVA